jgi:hypothetical protein
MNWNSAGIWCALAASVFIGTVLKRTGPTPNSAAVATVITGALVLTGLLLQLRFPTRPIWVQRDPGASLHRPSSQSYA